MSTTQQRDTKYCWVHHNGERLRNVGILADGSLFNPNNYPDETVRAAVLAANERVRARRCEAAKKAARTRTQHRERLVYTTVQRIVAGHQTGPSSHCCICGKGLGDTASIERGTGLDCWQEILNILARS